MSNALHEYIDRRAALFWYTPKDKLHDISDNLLVETILNYGTMDDVRELFRLIGIKTAAEIFFSSINTSERRKNNYFEPVINYFTLYFNQYAQ